MKQEEKDDIEKRDECKKSYTDAASVIATQDWKLEKNVAKTNKLDGLIKMREDMRAQTISDIKDVITNIAEMEAQRQQENAEFLSAD